jgi:hypothetical protein
MPVKAHYLDELALQQVETALSLFFVGDDYASVVTLAGAADEIFGKYLAADGKLSSLEELKKAVAAIHLKLYDEATPPEHLARRANLAKNSLKHWDVGDPRIVKFDLKQEAIDMLSRAIDNHWLFAQDLTPAMEKFEREVLRA